jgi:hypothetical protein
MNYIEVVSFAFYLNFPDAGVPEGDRDFLMNYFKCLP